VRAFFYSPARNSGLFQLKGIYGHLHPRRWYCKNMKNSAITRMTEKTARESKALQATLKTAYPVRMPG